LTRRSSPISLQDACVAVTGGANGIGRAIVEHFVRAGARVTIGDVDADGVQRLAAELGERAVGLALDVRDESAFTSFLDAAEERHGPLAVMVNNAGVDWMGPFHEESNEVSRREIAVNLMGTIVGSRLALQRMLPRGRGHLVNIASGAGRVPLPGSAVYAATKHGVVGLTESLRLEYRDTPLRFSVVHPAQVETAMLDGQVRPRFLPVVSPDDCAEAVLDAVRSGRFEVWVPSNQWVSVKFSNLLPRSLRERLMLALGVGKIAGESDQDARRGYHERMFGGER
jgi:NAD(P)-dependent dehydrogenase (short-subunit alcohol dehydrogenase family)